MANTTSKPQVHTSGGQSSSAQEKESFTNKMEFNRQKDDLLKRAWEIGQTNLSEIEGTPLSKQKLALVILNAIPFFSSFLHSVDGTGQALSQLASLRGRPTAQAASQGFRIAGVVLAAMDFVRIPFIMGASWLLGVKSPITLSKTARWLYSGVILGLTITAFMIPAAAPFIALATAGMALSVAVATFGKHFYAKYKSKKELNEVTEKIEAEMKGLKETQHSSEEIIEKLNSVTQEELPELKDELKGLKEDFDIKKSHLQDLKTEELYIQKKREKLGWSGTLNKGVALGLSALALVGILATIFSPPIGLALVATSAAGGGLYILGSLAVGITAKIFKSRQKASEPETPAAAQENQDKTANQVQETAHNSLTDVAVGMAGKGKDAAQILQKQIEEVHFLETAMEKLSQKVNNQDTKATVEFFKTMAMYTKVHNTELEQIQQFQKENKIMQPAINLFKQAIANGMLRNEDIQILQTYKPFVDFLEQQAIKVPQYQQSCAQEVTTPLNQKNENSAII